MNQVESHYNFQSNLNILFLIAILSTFGAGCASHFGRKAVYDREPSNQKAVLDPLKVPSNYNQYIAEARIWLGPEVWGESTPPSEAALYAGPKQKVQIASADEPFYCRYYPRISGGHNSKYRCYRTDSSNHLYDKKGVLQPLATHVDRVPEVVTFGRESVVVDEREILRDATGQDLGEADEVKVKYGSGIGSQTDNYTEVASTRLLWALGFPADKMFTTMKTICFDCPSQDPFAQDFGNAPRKAGSEFKFDHAVIEKKFDSKTIEDFTRQKYHAERFKNRSMSWGYSGWDFGQVQKNLVPKIKRELTSAQTSGINLEDEFNKGFEGSGTTGLSGALSRAVHFEALTLAASLIWHMSNDEHQHRLVCAKASITPDGLCGDPILVMQDVGSVFGGSGFLGKNSKGDLKKWAGNSIFKDTKKCELNLKLGTMGRAQLSTEGVRFFANLLNSLDDLRLRAIFKAARFDVMNGGGSGKVSIDAWISALKVKRAEIDQAARIGCPRSLRNEALGGSSRR